MPEGGHRVPRQADRGSVGRDEMASGREVLDQDPVEVSGRAVGATVFSNASTRRMDFLQALRDSGPSGTFPDLGGSGPQLPGSTPAASLASWWVEGLRTQSADPEARRRPGVRGPPCPSISTAFGLSAPLTGHPGWTGLAYAPQRVRHPQQGLGVLCPRLTWKGGRKDAVVRFSGQIFWPDSAFRAATSRDSALPPWRPPGRLAALGDPSVDTPVKTGLPGSRLSQSAPRSVPVRASSSRVPATLGQTWKPSGRRRRPGLGCADTAPDTFLRRWRKNYLNEPFRYICLLLLFSALKYGQSGRTKQRHLGFLCWRNGCAPYFFIDGNSFLLFTNEAMTILKEKWKISDKSHV
nr:uncharacterized protein LOC129143984 isoform X1 [Pan troglodytes]